MAYEAVFAEVFRWLHIFAGIIWIGHLYFFNFVNGPLQTKLDGPTKKAVNPELLPRALYWFRWGAAYTWFTGVLLLLIVFYHGKAVFEDASSTWTGGAILMIVLTFAAPFIYDALWKTGLANNLRAAVIVSFILLAIIVALYVFVGGFSYRGTLIHTGALFGTTMAFNVWYRIWPAQQKIIRAVKDGVAPDAALVKIAGLRSRHNTYMSLPLIWAMINFHTAATAFSGNRYVPSTYFWVIWLVLIIVAWHIVFQCYKRAGKVQGF